MILPLIAWESLPDFQLSDVDGMAGVNTMTPAVDKGKDIELVRRTSERTKQILAKTNGVLCTQHHRFRFFVNEVKISLAMGGTWGQGRRIRDLYPQAFTMPQYVIKGQSLTQEDYGLLCEFVHAHQQEAMGNGNTLQLSIKEGLPITPRHEFGGPGIAGHHEPIEVSGFVLKMPRQHTRYVYTPTFEFEFSVVRSFVGIISGSAYSFETVQQSFMELLENQEQPFSQAPGPLPPKQPKIVNRSEEEQLEKERENEAKTNTLIGPNLGSLPFEQKPKPSSKK